MIIKKRQRKKVEYSKVIITVLMSIQIVITIASIALMWYCHDTEGLQYLVPSISTELSIAVGFYYNKAKKENELKIRKAYREAGLKYINSEDNEEDNNE